MTDVASATGGITCLLTIHGVGFQQFPDDATGKPGYADGLHQRLSALLPELSDDPHRHRDAPGERGAIYVQSATPLNGLRSPEEGLRRLGHRPAPESTTLDLAGADLVQPGQRIAHVALVYTPSQEDAPDVGSLLETAARGLVSHAYYTSLLAEARVMAEDAGAVLHPPAEAAGERAPTVMLRTDVTHHDGLMRSLLERLHGVASAAAGPLEVLRTVEDDVAAYATRNLLRDAVRDFVREAVQRLIDRGDVRNIVVNAHSQGTVVAWDVLRTMPCTLARRIAAFVCLGSPLRKYATALDWGVDTGSIAVIPRWSNLWDARDPVADPLGPAPPWKRGDEITDATVPGLFLNVDPASGACTPGRVTDVPVDNLSNVGGAGLRAHDYWSNAKEVLPHLRAELLAAVR